MRSRASSCADPDSPRRRRRLPGLIAVAIAGFLLLPPGSGQAAPTKPRDPGKELDRLERRADALTKKYRGKLHELDGATEAARRAGKRVRKLERKRNEARGRVAELAAARYKSGAVDPMIVIAGSESPQGLLDRAATAQHLARTADERLRELQRLQEEARQATRDAQAQVDRARRLVDRLEARKDEVAKLVAKYEAQDEARKRREAAQRAAAAKRAAQREAAQRAERDTRDEGGAEDEAGAPDQGRTAARGGSSDDDGTSSPDEGGRSTSTPHPKSPRIGVDPITPRMRDVLNEVDQRFGPFPTIGCSRAGTSGEHPQGRACDFMLSTGGAMPSSAKVEQGWQVAKWARANASELGVMYVIYRQQIWDARSGGGWRGMEDRGSITQNHYDHVHISVF